MAIAAAERDERRQRLQYRIAASKLLHARHNVGWCHERPLVAICRQHRIEGVAPSAAIVTAAHAHEHGRAADQWPLALYGRPEDLADEDSFVHGLYSAQVRGVSLTRMATTSGQRSLHQS